MQPIRVQFPASHIVFLARLKVVSECRIKNKPWPLAGVLKNIFTYFENRFNIISIKQDVKFAYMEWEKNWIVIRFFDFTLESWEIE